MLDENSNKNKMGLSYLARPLILMNILLPKPEGSVSSVNLYIDEKANYQTISMQEIAIFKKNRGILIHDMSQQATLLPGYYETHIHGYHGHDFSSKQKNLSSGVKKIRAALLALGKTGITALMPTTVTLSTEKLKNRLAVINAFVAAEKIAPTPGVPLITGIHLEGPFIASCCRGAHDKNTLLAIAKEGISLAKFLAIISVAPLINHWKITIDPALKGMLAFLEQVKQGIYRENGERVWVYPFIGHANPTPAMLQKALATNTICGFTHLGNAMGELAQRHSDLQATTETLAAKVTSEIVKWVVREKSTYRKQPLYCELIVDGIHLSQAFVKYIREAIGVDKVILITDALGFTGLADGAYTLGAVPIIKKDNAFWLATREDKLVASQTLAGSAASYAEVAQQYLQWSNNNYQALLLASALNPRKALPLVDFSFKDSSNFILLNPAGEMLLNACNGVCYIHCALKATLAAAARPSLDQN